VHATLLRSASENESGASVVWPFWILEFMTMSAENTSTLFLTDLPEDAMTLLTRATVIPVAMFSAFVVGGTAQPRVPPGGLAGNVLTCGALVVTIAGTNGDDVINGTPGNDVIAGLGGNDIIRGGDGEDAICGGPGNDYIEGQGDEDVLRGEGGDDVLDGGEAGCCNVSTNTGDDVLSGGPGNDVLHTSDFPQAGNTLHGEQGDDRLFVWAAGLAIGAMAHANGGPGDDVIFQLTGDAELNGDGGRDLIIDGDDDGSESETITMMGATGKDRLVSEDATSTVDMDGGSNQDICVDGDVTSDCETVL
jgi:Ca2+-binding RTX toxin-like protein